MFRKKKKVSNRPILIIKDDLKEAIFDMKTIPFDEYAHRMSDKSKYPYGMGKEWEFEKTETT